MKQPFPQTMERLSPAQSQIEVESRNAVIVDVREHEEYAAEHIAGARSVPLAALSSAQLPREEKILLYCGAGKRSCAAAQQLIDSGYRNVAVIDGGISGWKTTKLPTIVSSDKLPQ